MQAWDRYAYANNNPVNLTDPTGHFACGEGIDDPRCDQYDSPIAPVSKYYPNDPMYDPDYSAWRLLADGSPCTACHVTHLEGVIPDNNSLDLRLVQYYRGLDPLSRFVHQAGMQSILNMNALAPIDELSLASNSPSVKGKFPTHSSSEYLQRPGHFARYDPATGEIMYRVDLVGHSDAGVPTPHLQYPKYNVMPSTGVRILNDWSRAVPYIDLNPILNPLTQSLLMLIGLHP